MIQRPPLPSQAEIDRALARGRQLRADAFADAMARFASAVAAGFAWLRPHPGYRGRPV